jgi:hypothetical protein
MPSYCDLLYLLLIQNWVDWYVPELSQSSASQHHGWVSLPIASRNVTQKVRSQILYIGMPEIFGHTIICLSILHTIRSWKSDLAVMAACMALLFVMVMVNILWATLRRLWLYSSSLYCLNCCGEYALHCQRSGFLWNITMHFTVWWSFPFVYQMKMRSCRFCAQQNPSFQGGKFFFWYKFYTICLSFLMLNIICSIVGFCTFFWYYNTISEMGFCFVARILLINCSIILRECPNHCVMNFM